MNYKEVARQTIESYKDDIIQLSDTIHENPELGHQEYQSSQLLIEKLMNLGYEIEKGIAGMDTAFIARKGKGKPTIGILAEYDALPAIGHACGHNLIASTAYGAAVGLKDIIDEIDGSIIVYGTPAEEGVVENAGGKVLMLDEIKKADAALMIHPGPEWGSFGSTNARESFMVEFFGKSSHAGAAPEKGVNALDGILLTFNGINARTGYKN